MTNRVLDIKWHLCECLVKVIWLEDRVPAKHVLTTWFDNLTTAAASENDGLGVGALAKSKNALSVSSLIVKVLDHLPEAFATDTAQEVLATMKNDVKKKIKLTYRDLVGHCRR